MAAPRGPRPPAAPPEGKAWWLELQRQRAQGACQDDCLIAAEPVSACTDAQEGDELERRRAALLCASKTLLRRMSRSQPGVSSSSSSQGGSTGGRQGIKSSAPAGRTAAAAATDAPPTAAGPVPLERRAGSQAAEQPQASDVQQMNRLLEGGLIGCAGFHAFSCTGCPNSHLLVVWRR